MNFRSKSLVTSLQPLTGCSRRAGVCSAHCMYSTYNRTRIRQRVAYNSVMMHAVDGGHTLYESDERTPPLAAASRRTSSHVTFPSK